MLSESLVTIVVPVFNRLHFLGETIESVLTQTHSQWELIVVDDGSEEDVAAFLLRYPDDRIRSLRQENQGNAAARNTGIKQAQGEYVICLDSDDVWQPGLLDICLTTLQTNPNIDVTYTQFQQIDQNSKLIPVPLQPQPKNGNLLPDLLLGFPILPSSALIRRCCFEQWGLYTPGLDDWELWLRWSAKGCRFHCVERPLLAYRIHNQNFNLDWPRRRQAHFAMLDAFYRQTDLPELALQLHQQAYVNQHIRFAVLAWQVNRPVDATAEFVHAVCLEPSLLHDLDFYTQIACAHQNRLDYGSARNLDLEQAQAILLAALDSLFAMPDLPRTIIAQREPACAWANLALARLAYGLQQDDNLSRRFLQQSLAAWPMIAVRSDWAMWFLRALLGGRKIHHLKTKVGGRFA